jgi:hypothetical protein
MAEGSMGWFLVAVRLGKAAANGKIVARDEAAVVGGWGRGLGRC